MRDLIHSIKATKVLAPIVVSDNTAAVGAIIDRLGYDSVSYVIQTGVLADADATFATLLEEGDASDMTGATTVASGDLIGTLSGASFTYADDGAVKTLGYIGAKRYTRLTITPTGNSGSAPLSVVAILGHRQACRYRSRGVVLRAQAARPTTGRDLRPRNCFPRSRSRRRDAQASKPRQADGCGM